MGEDGVQHVTLNAEVLRLGDGQLGIWRRGLAGGRDAAIIAVQITGEHLRARRAVGGAKAGLTAWQVGLEENHSGLLGLAVTHASPGYPADVRWERVYLSAIIEHPAFMMVKQAAIVIAHVKAGGDGHLPKV